jgi:hypothetical protein
MAYVQLEAASKAGDPTPSSGNGAAGGGGEHDG